MPLRPVNTWDIVALPTEATETPTVITVTGTVIAITATGIVTDVQIVIGTEIRMEGKVGTGGTAEVLQEGTVPVQDADAAIVEALHAVAVAALRSTILEEVMTMDPRMVPHPSPAVGGKAKGKT